MKVVFLSDDFPPLSTGGAGVSTYELAKGVAKAGHDVTVITTCRKESDSGEDLYDGLRVIKLVSSYTEKWRAYVSLYNPSVLGRLREILSQINPDVVHVNNVHHHLSYHSIKLSKKYAKAVVITLRDAMSFSFGKLETEGYLDRLDTKLTWFDQWKQARKRWNPFRNLFIRKYLCYADKIFAVSNALKLALEQNGIRGVEVMYSGIDMLDYHIPDIDIDDKMVLFPGRLSRAKGSDVALRAMEMVSQFNPNAKLITVDTNARWYSRKEMNMLYAKSCVVLVPSICFDAFPRSVIEAMALGRPVIGTRYGGAPEAIVDEETGFVVDPRDIKNLADKIIELLNDKVKREQFGTAARARIKSDFNLEKKIQELTSEYAKLVKNHGK